MDIEIPKVDVWRKTGKRNHTVNYLIFYNLPFVDQCCLVLTKINLILRAIGGVDNRLDGCVYEFTRVHVDFDFVANRELPWGRVGLFLHGAIVRQSTRGYWVPEINSRREI